MQNNISKRRAKTSGNPEGSQTHLATLKAVRLIWQSLFNVAFRKAIHLDLFFCFTGV